MLALQIFLVRTVKEPRWLTPSLTNQEVGDQLPEGWLDVKHTSFFVWRNLLNTHGLGIWRECMSLRNKQKLKCLVSALPLIWSKICNYIQYCCKTKYWKLWTIYVQLQHLQINFFFLFVFVGACYTKHIILIIIQIFHEWKRKSVLLLMVVKIFLCLLCCLTTRCCSLNNWLVPRQDFTMEKQKNWENVIKFWFTEWD